MNDLIFGTTLFASFASLIATVIIEATSPLPAPHDAVSAIVRSRPAPEQLADAGRMNCPKLAQATVSRR